MGRLTLVLGGARSGKSAFAERLVAAVSAPVVYVATAEAIDEEMAARIARHRADRPAAWTTIEAARDLPSLVVTADVDRATLLIDCVSVWLSNELMVCLGGERGEVLPVAAADACECRLLNAVDELVALAQQRTGETIVVSNEVGSGLVPAYALGRLYRDVLGRSNQRIAESCAAVYLVVAGVGVELRRLAAETGFADGDGGA